MANLNDMLKSTSTEKLEQLMTAPETKKVFSMLSQNMNCDLEQAAGKAAEGDTTQLVNAIKQLMKNPESARLIQQMKSKIE